MMPRATIARTSKGRIVIAPRRVVADIVFEQTAIGADGQPFEHEKERRF
jgi:hypothetical protein